MTAPTPLDVRYGRTRARRIRGRVWTVGLGTAGLTAAVLWVAWIGLFATGPQVSVRDLGFSLGADSATLRYEVTAPPGRVVGCAVRANSASNVTVGWKVVTLSVSDQRTRRLTATVRTSQPPAAALIYRCWLA